MSPTVPDEGEQLNSSVKILISAGEASSDVHGAILLNAIRDELNRQGRSLKAFGIGGPKLQAAGLEAIVDTRHLMVMGFVAVLKHVPRILRILNRTVKIAQERKPDLAVVIDYPDFHFRLSKRLKKSGIPVIYYIPPKVWVWRKQRLRYLKENFEKILCILPFEESFYQAHEISSKYVGNPLMDELPFHLDRESTRRNLKLSANDQVIVLMPGSRSAELKRHIPLMRKACELLAEKLAAEGRVSKQNPLKILVPFPLTLSSLQLQVWKSKLHDGTFLSFQVFQGNAAECLIAADVGMIKSGTSTLEAGLLGCPHVIAYQTDPISSWIYKRWVQYTGPVGLVNLISGSLVKELLLEEATPEALCTEVFRLLTDSDYRQKMLDGFKQLQMTLRGNGPGISPGIQAAREILACLE